MVNQAQFRACMGSSIAKENEDFSMAISTTEKPYESGAQHKAIFPYPIMICTPHFPIVEPHCFYVLYCPNTGCPFQPELQTVCRSNSKGQISIYAEGLSELLPDDHVFDMNISLWDIPGFCSDWYLYKSQSKDAYHTTFTHQPIIAKGSDGREISLRKKECGGNLIDVCFSGFLPHETVRWLSNSEEEQIEHTSMMDEKGSSVQSLLPQVNGKDRGIVEVSLLGTHEPLKTRCDWDMKTLFIKRTQRDSGLVQMCIGKSEKNKKIH